MRRPFGWVLLAIAGCSRATTPPVDISAEVGFSPSAIRRVAVVPAVPGRRPGEVSPRALEGVTELLSEAIGAAGRWEVIDPQRTREALGGEVAGAPAIELASRAAERTDADAAVIAVVDRYRERVGTDYGALTPASVALEVLVVRRGASAAAWRAEYSFTQEPLAYNFWNLWGLLRGGPRWLTARELARIGVEEATARLFSTR
jgi:hypothetical protein